MKTLTLASLEKHQDETLTTLHKELEIAWKEVNEAQDKVDVINDAIAKFQAQILMSQTKWKIDENN